MSNARPSDPFNLCQFPYADGRLCAMPAHPKHNGLYLHHAKQVMPKPTKPLPPAPREDDLSNELRSPVDDFITQIDINHVLGKLFDALSANRLSSKRAGTLAYIACLLKDTQKSAMEEARRWETDLPLLKKIEALKYGPEAADDSEEDEEPEETEEHEENEESPVEAET
jgi:hypothetical protein